jgi:hypothetical protein
VTRRTRADRAAEYLYAAAVIGFAIVLWLLIRQI